MLAATQVLKNPNYRLYFIGQFLSLSGTWMQSVAQAWLVYRVSGSATWLGIVTFATQFPAFILSPLAGVVADRRDRRKVLLAVQWISMLQAIVLGVLVFTNQVTLWHIVTLALLLGVVNSFDMTVRHTFVVDMVGKEELHNAIALNSVLINIARIIGPSIAGIVISLTGEKWCFFLNGLSYIAAIYGFSQMKITPIDRSSARASSVLESLSEGWRYVRSNPLVLKIILLLAFISFLSPVVMVLLPVFAKTVLHGNATTYAWLAAMVGSGAILGAMLFGAESSIKALRRDVSRSIAMIGASMALLGVSQSLPLSLLAVFLMGCFLMSTFPRLNNAVQHIIEDRMRGRTTSIYMMAFLGTMPLGSLLTGWISDHIGAPATVILFGAFCLMTAVALRFGVAMLNGYRSATPVRSESGPRLP